eukprot:TRINITY_DN5414_c1_g1_i1.p1 TRINITY_DN5414_c1_g1~~TRINITY_DN5414_c1_g1_i1.p1  ORF type:complete len:479 (+),score=81.27 TRINITY_DN5414_c1_g1_i1:38-1474(+)
MESGKGEQATGENLTATAQVSTAFIPGLEDEDIVATMYGPWHNGGDSVRAQRTEFWKAAIDAVASKYQLDSLSLNDLLSWFQSNSVRPRCLPDVVSVLMDESTPALISISQLRLRTPPPSPSSQAPSTPKKLLNVVWRWGSNAVGAFLSSPPPSRPSVDANEPLIVLSQANKKARSLWAALTSRVESGASWVDLIVTMNDPVMTHSLSTIAAPNSVVGHSRSLQVSDLLRLMRLDSPDRRLLFDASGEIIGILVSQDAIFASLSQADCDRVARVKMTINHLQSRIQQLDSELVSLSKTISTQRSKNPACTAASLKPLLRKRIYQRKCADKLRIVSSNLKDILDNIVSSSDNIVLVSTMKEAHSALQSVNLSLSSVATPDSIEDLLGEVQSAIDDQSEFSNALSNLTVASLDDEQELQSEYDLLELEASTKAQPVKDSADSLMAELEALTLTSPPVIPSNTSVPPVPSAKGKEKELLLT